MIAFVNGIQVIGSPQEIAEFQKITKSDSHDKPININISTSAYKEHLKQQLLQKRIVEGLKKMKNGEGAKSYV